MTPYFMFVIVLTIAYIIYYGYHISKDLYGKKGQSESSEEELVISTTDSGITPTPVREVSDGFTLGYQRKMTDAPEIKPEPAEETTREESNSRNHSATEEKLANLANQMEDAKVMSEGGFSSEELATAVLGQDPAIVCKPVIHHHREQF